MMIAEALFALSTCKHKNSPMYSSKELAFLKYEGMSFSRKPDMVGAQSITVSKYPFTKVLESVEN